MEATILAAALLSALLHAGWNAAVKAAADPPGAMAAQVVAAGTIAAPLLLVVPPPPVTALPWLAGSALFNLLTLAAFLRAYALGGDFGLVYPVARAASPVLVLLLASALAGETLGPLATAGVVLVAAGVALFAHGAGRPAALAYALFAGAFAAGYAFCDAQGARLSPSVAGYGFAVAVANAAIFGGFHHLRRRGSLIAALRANARIATFGAAAATLSYLLILWVWTRAPIAVGAALRDTSVVFAALIAAAALKERLPPLRVVAVAVVAAGAVALRFG